MTKRHVKMYYDDLTSEAVKCPERRDKKISGFSVDEGYDFLGKERNVFYRALSFIVYRVIMTPIARIYCRFFLCMKISDNRTKKPARGEGCFLFRNHVLTVGDAFEPSVEMKGKKVSVVVSPKNLSLRGTRTFLKMCGALPVPTGIRMMKRFSDAVKKRIGHGYCVTVYPEAHVWPYYNEIRPFGTGAFGLAVSTGAPVYVSTTVFRKGRRPRVTTVLDGPLYAESGLSRKDAEAELSGRVHLIMENRASQSCDTSYYVKYEKKGTNE